MAEAPTERAISQSPAAADRPYFSVIVPVLDGAVTLGACLEALEASSFADFELLVVDDGSTDDSGEIARRAGARVLETSGREGPGAARNLGARHSLGEVLFFVDADCSVEPQTLARAAGVLQSQPEIDALFGSYDDSPSAPGLVARFKNLQHHFVHQQSEEIATTFWAGCGAIRRPVFERLAGFDTDRFGRPSIEDIDLGYRLRRAGGEIRLIKDLQVKHHKAWSFASVLRTDLLDRGIPWTLLMLEGQETGRDLNLDFRARASVVLALLLVLGLLLAPFWPRCLLISAGAGLILLWLNARFYAFLLRRGGLPLMLSGVVLHWIYQLNCAVAYLGGRFLFWRRGPGAPI